jgi:hypothetical protein
MGSRGFREIAIDRRLEIDPEGGQGATWTVEPVKRES